MRRGGTAGSVRLWAVRLLMVCALAVCAGAVRAPMHSPGPMPSAASLAISPAENGTAAEARTIPMADDRQAGVGQQMAPTDVLKPSAHAQGSDPDCGCCAHQAAMCCMATTENSSRHGCLPAQDSDGYEAPALVPAAFPSHTGPVPSWSLSELSLLRI